MHRGEFSIVRLSNVYIERLALVNVGPTVSSHLQDALLGNFPHSPVQVLEILRNAINILQIERIAILANFPSHSEIVENEKPDTLAKIGSKTCNLSDM